MFRLIKSLIKSIGKGIYTDPEIQIFFSKHQWFKKFLSRRLTLNQKFGLVLTVGVVITVFFIFLFFGVLEDYIGYDPLIAADLRILNLVQILRTSTVNNVMLFITYLGDWPVVVAGICLAGIFLTWRKRWYYLFMLCFSYGIGEALVALFKIVIARPRPPLVNALAPEITYSFPSGHTFAAIAFYGLLAYFIYRDSQRKTVKFFAVVVALGVIGAIGFSRIYLGAHWPSDVLASYAVGAAWLAALITALEIHRKFGEEKENIDVKKNKKWLFGIGLVVAWLIFTVSFFLMHPLKAPMINASETVKIAATDLPDKVFMRFPRTSEDLTGRPMEPIDIVFVANQKELDAAFERAGWLRADRINLKTAWKSFWAFVLREPYPTALGSPSFWNSVPNDFAYEKSTDKNVINEREHIHFWSTPFIVGEKNVWLATAHFDKAISFSAKGHVIDPAIDKEREKVKQELQATSLIKSIQEFQIVEPTLGSNQAGNAFFTDGKAYIIEF